VVCSDCATLGSISWELKAPKATATLKPPKPLKKPRLKTTTMSQSPLEPTLELAEDFGTLIRQAREAQKLSHEDLGRRINERISLLKKLESQKMTPDNKLAEKLQYALKIKLLVPVKKEKLPKGLLTTAPPSKTITLGDMIKRKEE
jgi:putative transcription factor